VKSCNLYSYCRDKFGNRGAYVYKDISFRVLRNNQEGTTRVDKTYVLSNGSFIDDLGERTGISCIKDYYFYINERNIVGGKLL